MYGHYDWGGIFRRFAFRICCPPGRSSREDDPYHRGWEWSRRHGLYPGRRSRRTYKHQDQTPQAAYNRADHPGVCCKLQACRQRPDGHGHELSASALVPQPWEETFQKESHHGARGHSRRHLCPSVGDLREVRHQLHGRFRGKAGEHRARWQLDRSSVGADTKGIWRLGKGQDQPARVR